VVRRAVASAIAGLLVVGPAATAGATPGPASAPEYWFDTWHVQSLWDSGARGQGITIGEIDSGVNASLPELHGRILSGKDFGAPGNGQIDRDRDAFGHGTAMASIMVARPGLFGVTGLAPAAKVLPIAVPLDGTTTAGGPDKIPQAIRYAANHHAQIISMSIGGPRTPRRDPEPCSNDEQAAIFYALRKGALVVASVGNTGPKRNTVEDPGVCLGVLAVGAVDRSGKVAFFSAREPYLSLVAPGVDIPTLSRVPGRAYSGAGTSQATALTSAAAALVWSAHPNLDARGVALRILATLDARHTTPSRAYGYGHLDAYRAVTAHVPAGAPNPVFDQVAPFLARTAALAKALPKPARAATQPVSALGTYSVGSVPRLTGQVWLGIALAVVGLFLLLTLLLVRRAHPRLRPAGPVDGADDGTQ
jgi:subtilisin family serine protease